MLSKVQEAAPQLETHDYKHSRRGSDHEDSPPLAAPPRLEEEFFRKRRKRIGGITTTRHLCPLQTLQSRGGVRTPEGGAPRLALQVWAWLRGDSADAGMKSVFGRFPPGRRSEAELLRVPLHGRNPVQGRRSALPRLAQRRRHDVHRQRRRGLRRLRAGPQGGVDLHHVHDGQQTCGEVSAGETQAFLEEGPGAALHLCCGLPP